MGEFDEFSTQDIRDMIDYHMTRVRDGLATLEGRGEKGFTELFDALERIGIEVPAMVRMMV